MRLAIYNQELSDHVESATRQQQAGSPSAALARKFANMPPPQSPRGNVLGALLGAVGMGLMLLCCCLGATCCALVMCCVSRARQRQRYVSYEPVVMSLERA